MVRPSFFLVCQIKVPEWRRRLLIPLPLWVLDDLLQAGFSIWRLATRFRPQLASAIGSCLPGLHAALPELNRLFTVLQRSGPFTLLDVDIPDEGVQVSVKLI